jgi:hypothetical protein
MTISHTSSPPGTARALRCTRCWAPPGQPCQRRPAGDHLQRWLDAYRAGAVTKAELAAALVRLDVITTWSVIPDVTP